MKLIGARSFQILGMYIVLILAFGGIALLISVPLSGQAGYALAEFAAYHFNFQSSRFPPGTAGGSPPSGHRHAGPAGSRFPTW